MPPFLVQVALLPGWPEWLSFLAISVAIAYTLCVFGVVFGKMGRSPLWGLVFVAGPVAVPVLWWLAFRRWPVVSPDRP